MTAVRLRPLAAVLLAIVSAAVLGVTPLLTPALLAGMERLQKLIADIKLLADDDLGWIMTGTGTPVPPESYLSQIEQLFLPSSPLFAGQPTFDGYTFEGLTTPEQFCPFVCLPPPNPQLNFGDSLAQGVGILNDKIVPALQDGDNVAVFGYSQSATISTIEMQDLIKNPPAGVDLSNLHVVLIGDPNNPIGGMLTRLDFPDGVQPFSLSPASQHVPFVNIPLSIGPTPTEPIATDIYTGEYDGWAAFPQDPSNILADINALIGISTVHPTYPHLTPGDVASAINVGAIGDAHFYDIPENLPILGFMFDGGTAGQFFGDFFSPWARLTVDWGYGNAGDPAVDGLHLIPVSLGGSPYEAAFGVAGGPWAATPLGALWDGSGVAGFFEKMDPLQLLAGVQNALIQSVIGPWADVAAAGGALSAGDIATVAGITQALQAATGYDLVNSVDTALLTGWNDLANAVDLGSVIGPAALLDGPLISGKPVIDLVGGVFDIFNFFGA